MAARKLSDPRKLLLWDIDGTLMLSDRAGERALATALTRVFNIAPRPTRIDMAGRTDRYIAEGILREHGLEPTEDRLHDFFEGYVTALVEEMPKGKPRMLAGVARLLEAVAARSDLAQGLLTGNLERSARIKLTHFAVWHYFPFGAFADDSALRSDLGPHALRRATRHHARTFAPQDVFVIGDTPHDIECGQAIGANTIAVATGHFSGKELAAHRPGIVLPSLEDPAPFFAFVDGTKPPSAAS